MTISVVQSKLVTDATSGSLTSPTTAGNCLAVCLCTFMSSNVTITLSGVTLGGSAGNFAQAAKVQSAFTSSTQFAAVWADPNCAGGQTAVAVSGTNLNLVASADTGFVIFEIAGLVTSSPVDQPQTSSGTSGASPTTGTTAATSQANEIALAALTAESAISAFTSGYTVTSINDGGGVFSAGAYKILSATGTQSFGCTQSPTTTPWAGAIATLKAPLAGSSLPLVSLLVPQSVKRSAYY